ncbi:MAG: hypothetical protein ABR941_09990 [Thermoleophilia bacterium]
MVVVGALLGVAGFAFEQAHADWRPHATRTALGWRVTQPYLGFNQPALAGDHLAWQAGPYTIVMDLSSGKTRLVGDALDAQLLAPPAVSPDAAVWVQYSGGARERTQIYAYDFSSRRRQCLLNEPTDLAGTSPVVAGATAYWLSDQGGTTSVTACDIASGRRRLLARGAGYGPFLLAEGPLVAWSHQSQPSAPFTMTLLDAAGGTTDTLTLPGQSSGAIFDAPVLANDTIVWLRVDEQDTNDTISAYDLDTIAARQIASAGELVGPGFDGTTVVWAQPVTGGSGDVVMGLRLPGGAPFRIAAVPRDVQSVMVSGDTVAWCIGTGLHSWIQTARLPQ